MGQGEKSNSTVVRDEVYLLIYSSKPRVNEEKKGRVSSMFFPPLLLIFSSIRPLYYI